jgi:hypothetical protein
MLAMEKKRAAWSLAVGVLLAIAAEGTGRALVWRATQRLRASVADCEKPDPTNPVGKGHWVSIFEPSDLRGMKTTAPNGTYTEPLTDDDLITDGGVTAQIIRNDQTVTEYRADEWLFSGIVLAFSFVPFVWYFLLDRIAKLAVPSRGATVPSNTDRSRALSAFAPTRYGCG